MAWYRAGGGGIPSSLKTGMNNVLNKKFGTSTTYAPATWPDNVNLLGPLPEKTVSGAIASFSDGADDVPISDCKFYFNPKQASGTPSPTNPLAITGWTGLTAVHCGANIWNEQWETGTYDATTGQPGYSSSRIRSKVGNDIFVQGLTSLYIVAPENVRCIFLDDNGNVLSAPSSLHNGTVTVTTGAVWCRFFTAATYGGTYNNDISINSPNTATAYNAYNAETKAVTWTEQGTIYGGYVTKDKVVKTWSDSIALNTLEWYKTTVSGETYFMAYLDDGNLDNTKIEGKATTYLLDGILADKAGFFVSNGSTCAVYIRDDNYTTAEDFTANVTGSITYLLETPIEYDITALNLATYYGDNNFWSEGDTASVDYRADIALALGGGS